MYYTSRTAPKKTDNITLALDISNAPCSLGESGILLPEAAVARPVCWPLLLSPSAHSEAQ